MCRSSPATARRAAGSYRQPARIGAPRPAIASATGAAYNTVLKDVTQIESPAAIIGADGKSYAATRPAAQPGQFDGSDWLEPATQLS